MNTILRQVTVYYQVLNPHKHFLYMFLDFCIEKFDQNDEVCQNVDEGKARKKILISFYFKKKKAGHTICHIVSFVCFL